MRCIEEAKIAKETITDRVIITELETLMMAARDAVKKAVRSLAAELTDVSLLQPDTTNTELTMNSPWSRPIGNTALRTVVNLLHLVDPENTPKDDVFFTPWFGVIRQDDISPLYRQNRLLIYLCNCI